VLTAGEVSAIGEAIEVLPLYCRALLNTLVALSGSSTMRRRGKKGILCLFGEALWA
jgi:hypothetical protein